MTVSTAQHEWPWFVVSSDHEVHVGPGVSQTTCYASGCVEIGECEDDEAVVGVDHAIAMSYVLHVEKSEAAEKRRTTPKSERDRSRNFRRGCRC